jgi:hypothetical protein
VGLAELLGPRADEGLVGGFGSCVDGLSCDAEARASRGDEDDASAAGEVRLDGLGEEDGTLDIGVEVLVVELGGGVNEVSFETLGGAVEARQRQ